MIVTLTLNPCWDKTLMVTNYEHSGLNRVRESRVDIAGKGLNVSAALSSLGLTTLCLGFSFQEDRCEVEKILSSRNIAFDFVCCPGKTRTNTKVFERDSGRMTEFNEMGDRVTPDLLQELLCKVEKYACSADIFVVSGSVPPGVPPDFYETVIRTAHNKKKSSYIILDAERDLLRHGLKAGPDLIKPNLFELEKTFGVTLNSREEILRLCRSLVTGDRLICVSMGKDGALLVGKECAYSAPALEVTVKSLQGAGDSMVAGICKGFWEKRKVPDILRCAMAAAAATIEMEGTRFCELADFERLFSQTQAIKI